jgi:hypothetical protein
MANSTTAEPFIHFAKFVDKTKREHVGRDRSNNPSGYIPASVLRKYWTKKRLAQVLAAFNPKLSCDLQIIADHYLRTFSALVYAGQTAASHLVELVTQRLSDDHFPLEHAPPNWNSPLFQALFRDLSSIQWIFFPFTFERSRLQSSALHPSVILPIEVPQPINTGSSARAQSVLIHDEYNHLVPRVSPPTTCIYIYIYLPFSPCLLLLVANRKPRLERKWRTMSTYLCI